MFDPARFVDTRDKAVGLIIDDDSTSNTLESTHVTVVFPNIMISKHYHNNYCVCIIIQE